MLYEEDYLAWTKQQIGLLQTGKLEELDLKNLVEELRDGAQRSLRIGKSFDHTDRTYTKMGVAIQ